MKKYNDEYPENGDIIGDLDEPWVYLRKGNLHSGGLWLDGRNMHDALRSWHRQKRYSGYKEDYNTYNVIGHMSRLECYLRYGIDLENL